MTILYFLNILIIIISHINYLIKFYAVNLLRILYNICFGKPKIKNLIQIPKHLAVLFVNNNLINFVTFFFF